MRRFRRSKKNDKANAFNSNEMITYHRKFILIFILAEQNFLSFFKMFI